MVSLKHFNFLPVLIILLVATTTTVQSHLLQLFDKKHFYELIIERVIFIFIFLFYLKL